jgi:hypothetical protein
VSTRSASAAAHVAARPDVVFPRLREHDPARFYPRWGLLPAVVVVRDQTGPWDAPGRTRTLVLSDGGSVVETLTSAEAPLFAYDLSTFTGLFGRLVAGGRSEWRVTAAGEGSSIDWTYSFTPLPGRGPIVGAIVRLAWGPYMRRVLPRIAGWTAGS